MPVRHRYFFRVIVSVVLIALLAPTPFATAAFQCQDDAPCDDDGSGLSTGAIAGIAVGSALLVGGAIWWFVLRKKSEDTAEGKVAQLFVSRGFAPRAGVTQEFPIAVSWNPEGDIRGSLTVARW